jgi:hypothetical protein
MELPRRIAMVSDLGVGSKQELLPTIVVVTIEVKVQSSIFASRIVFRAGGML